MLKDASHNFLFKSVKTSTMMGVFPAYVGLFWLIVPQFCTCHAAASAWCVGSEEDFRSSDASFWFPVTFAAACSMIIALRPNLALYSYRLFTDLFLPTNEECECWKLALWLAVGQKTLTVRVRWFWATLKLRWSVFTSPWFSRFVPQLISIRYHWAEAVRTQQKRIMIII